MDNQPQGQQEAIAGDSWRPLYPEPNIYCIQNYPGNLFGVNVRVPLTWHPDFRQYYYHDCSHEMLESWFRQYPHLFVFTDSIFPPPAGIDWEHARVEVMDGIIVSKGHPYEGKRYEDWLWREYEGKNRFLDFRSAWHNKEADFFSFHMEDYHGNHYVTEFNGKFGRLLFDAELVRKAAEVRKVLEMVREGWSEDWSDWLSKKVDTAIKRAKTWTGEEDLPAPPHISEDKKQIPDDADYFMDVEKLPGETTEEWAERALRENPASAILQKHLTDLYHHFNITMFGEHEPRARRFIEGLAGDLARLDRKNRRHHISEEMGEEVPEEISSWFNDWAQPFVEAMPTIVEGNAFVAGAIAMYRKIWKAIEKQNVAILGHLAEKDALRAELSSAREKIKERDHYRKSLEGMLEEAYGYAGNTGWQSLKKRLTEILAQYPSPNNQQP